MANNQVVADGGDHQPGQHGLFGTDEAERAALTSRVDPEAIVGRALRQKRVARGWSQEEVARRMEAFGYDFHQTMIAKVEAAQRPLRVRELADFAALYGVEIQELMYPPSVSREETDREIAVIEKQLATAKEQAAEARAARDSAQRAAAAASETYQASTGEAARLEGRLASLIDEQRQFAEWEARDRPARRYPDTVVEAVLARLEKYGSVYARAAHDGLAEIGYSLHPSVPRDASGPTQSYLRIRDPARPRQAVGYLTPHNISFTLDRERLKEEPGGMVVRSSGEVAFSHDTPGGLARGLEVARKLKR